MKLLVAVLSLLCAPVLALAAPPLVETQAPGVRPSVEVTVSGRVAMVGGGLLAGARVGVSGSGVGSTRTWMPAGSVDSDASFEFRTRLSEGEYEVVAAAGTLEVASARIRVSGNAGERAFNVALEPRAEARPGSELHFDAPPELPPEGLIANPAELRAEPQPAPPPPGPGWSAHKNRVRVFYATNRNVAAPRDAGPVAWSEFADTPGPPSYGFADVAVTFERAPRFGVMLPDKYQFRTYRIQRYPDDAAFAQGLEHDAQPDSSRDVLLFVHGYNTPLADGIYRTAQFAVELGFKGVPVLFAWPGGEHWWEYGAAADRVESAANELAGLLRLLVGRDPAPKLYVVAHSMGNRVLARAIEQLADDPGTPPASSRTLVLAAPDIDRSQFAGATRAIARLFQRRTVYVSDTDVALRVSRVVNQQPRVGQRYPLGVGSEFEIVDATGARDTIIGHSYFVDSDSIALDIAKALVQEKSAAQRGLSFVLEDNKTVWRLPR